MGYWVDGLMGWLMAVVGWLGRWYLCKSGKGKTQGKARGRKWENGKIRKGKRDKSPTIEDPIMVYVRCQRNSVG